MAAPLAPTGTAPAAAVAAMSSPATNNSPSGDLPSASSPSTVITSTETGPTPPSTAAAAPRPPLPSTTPRTFLNFERLPDLSLPLDLSPSTSPLDSNHSHYNHNSSSLRPPLGLLRRFPTDLNHPVLQECDEESVSENEPITPASARPSRDFDHHQDSISHTRLAASSPDRSVNAVDKKLPGDSLSSLHLSAVYVTAVEPSPSTAASLISPASAPEATSAELSTTVTSPPEEKRQPDSKRPSSTQSSKQLPRCSPLSRAMDFFRRNSHVGEKIATEPSYDAGTPETANASAQKTPPSASGRPFSQHRSVRTTGSNSPPSLGSPSKDPANKPEQGLPTSRDFFENNSRKHRSHTGFSFRQTVKFTSTKNATPKRTRSLEKKKQDDLRLTRQPWAIGPEAGTGLKARRLSLSLPDDFAIDIGKLTEEFEYQHKLFGRHGRHLGKGATSKVTLMARKGFPTELYAVKEFRSKKSSETAAEYEGKIKSEYSIAKSLHHPNCIETMRLCTDHGRWNHVMEYCSEGDLFNLVSKRYLSDMLRESDRLCLFKQLCQGINYLHSHGIAHRDIKLENLLITKDSKVKITDFGVSEVFSGIHPGLREAGGQCGLQMGEVRLCKPAICGSFPYIAPEVLAKEHEYDPRPLDVWSSAVVMIYLTFNGPLWEKAEETPGPNSGGYNQLVTAWAKLDAKRAKDPAAVDKDIFPKFDAFECIVETIPLRRMLLNMLHPNPKKRITMEQVMRKPWMKSIECCQYENYDGPVKPIDAYKKNGARGSHNKIFCHNHLPPKREGGSLPPMPGKPGY